MIDKNQVHQMILLLHAVERNLNKLKAPAAKEAAAKIAKLKDEAIADVIKGKVLLYMFH